MSTDVPNFTLKEFVNAVIREAESGPEPEISVTVTDEEALMGEIAELVTKAQRDPEMPVTDLVNEMESVELEGEYDVGR